ncbi:MAG: sugar-binding protein [Eubacteriales bacterium]
MKKLYAVLLAVTLILTLSISASAASDKILKGTPTLDGVLDEIYLQSVEVVLGGAFYSTNSDNTTDVTGKAYLLYDEKNLYVCVVVNDDDILSRDDAYINEGDNPWENEAVEIWVDEGMAANKSKLSFDASGKRFYFGPDPVGLGATTKAMAVKGDKTYTVEYVIPLATAGAEGAKYGFSLQVNDLFADNHVVALGSQEPVEYTFGAGSSPPRDRGSHRGRY